MSSAAEGIERETTLALVPQPLRCPRMMQPNKLPTPLPPSAPLKPKPTICSSRFGMEPISPICSWLDSISGADVITQ